MHFTAQMERIGPLVPQGLQVMHVCVLMQEIFLVNHLNGHVDVQLFSIEPSQQMK